MATTTLLVCECDNDCTHWEIGLDFIKCKTCGHIFENIVLLMKFSALESTGHTTASFKEREA